MTYVIYAALALLVIGLVGRVVRFPFRLVVVLGVLGLFAGVLVKSLHAQGVEIHPRTFLKHGVWSAIGLNNGSELRVVFDHDDDCLRCNSDISSGSLNEMYAQLTFTRFFGFGPATTLDFTGEYIGYGGGFAEKIATAYGMPEASVVCGTLFRPAENLTCFIFEVVLDGYIPGSDGFLLYTTILVIKIVEENGGLIFDGEMRNPIPLRVNADGTIIW